MGKVEHLTFTFPPWVHFTDQTNNYSAKLLKASIKLFY